MATKKKTEENGGEDRKEIKMLKTTAGTIRNKKIGWRTKGR